MNDDNSLNYDPWQKLSKEGQVTDVTLNEALKKLEVPEEEAPLVKKDMLSKVQKLAKSSGTGTKSKARTTKKKGSS